LGFRRRSSGSFDLRRRRRGFGLFQGFFHLIRDRREFDVPALEKGPEIEDPGGARHAVDHDSIVTLGHRAGSAQLTGAEQFPHDFGYNGEQIAVPSQGMPYPLAQIGAES
jgi:hypothetical protein